MNFKTIAMISVLMLGLSACSHKAHKHEGCACGHHETKKCDGKECAVSGGCADCKKDEAAK